MAQKYFRKAGVPLETVAVAEDGVPEWLQRRVPAAGSAMGGVDRLGCSASTEQAAWHGA